jgi:DNA end-binding protein Ku
VPRSIWTGWVGFGLVLIPVRLFPATTPRDVRFHEFARGTGRRVRHRRVVEEEAPWDLRRWTAATEEASAATPSSQPELEDEPELEPEPAPEPHPAEEQPAFQSPAVSARPREVEFEDVVKGYEVEPGRYVMLERDELEALRPTADRTIHIERFVPLDEIDPVYFERSYYLAPGSAAQAPAGAERAYGLLLAALEQAGRVGIGRFVMRTREYLAAVRPMDGVLGLETLFFSDEVRRAADVVAYGLPGDASGRELNVAMKLIEVMAGDWDPGEYADTYRERVMDLIRQKAEGLEPVIEEEPSPRPAVADLLAALRQSVDEARDRSGSGMKKKEPRGRRASG